MLTELWELNLVFGTFAVLFISIGRISFAVNKYYRCPACDKVPMIVNSGVLADPKVCPHCDAQLK